MKDRFFQISAFFFFYFALIGVYVIFLPKILQNIGYTPAQIGIIFSIAPLMRFITPFFFLKIFALTTTVLHRALFTMFVTIFLFYTTIEDFYWFIVTNILYGISSGLVLPYIETYALEVLKKENYGRARLYGSLGFIFVALALARLLNDNHIPLHAIAVTILFSIVFAGMISTDHRHFSNKSPKTDTKFLLSKATALWISVFLMQVSFGAFYSFFTIYESEHGVALTTISYLWTFGVICEIVLFYYQARILHLPLLRIIRFTILITSVRWTLLFLFPENLAVIFISQSLHAFSFALYHTATLSYLSGIYHDKKLAAQFYYGIGFGLGGFFGSLIAGYVYGAYLFAVSAVIALLAFISLLFYDTKQQLQHRNQ
ncbi:MAG: MFS transporter [Sulfurospirillum sp.]|nr:MAG: MFS transporter [Sulfurospirillum sp.]